MSKAAPETVAAQLQAQSEQVQKAQEVIDRDPEEAQAILEPHTTVKGGGEITIQDIWGLFMQMQAAQQTMQRQVIELLSKDRQRERNSYQAHSAEDLALAQEQQRKTLEAWDTEPRLPVFLTPTEDEERIFAVMGEYPPRMHRVNGLEFPIKVGEVQAVPQSIAAEIKWAQTYAGRRKKPPQGLPNIADPQRGQFLASSQVISPGRDGKSGEGPLYAAAAARSPDEAQPLDVRYDAYGR